LGGAAPRPPRASGGGMLEPVMTMNDGAAIYSPGGNLLQAGERLRQPGLVRALGLPGHEGPQRRYTGAPAVELLADGAPQSAYTGSLAVALLALMDERGGLVTRDDLEAYEATWSEPVE